MKNKKKILFVSLLFFLYPLFSAPPPGIPTTPVTNPSTVTSNDPESQTENAFKKILGTVLTITGSVYIRILATVSLIYIGIKLILTKNKQEFLKRCYAWIIACILVTLAPAVVNKVFKIKSSIKELQTFSLFNTPSYSETKKSK